LDICNIQVAASYYSEVCPDCCLVAATNFPCAHNLGDVGKITNTQIAAIVKLWPNCSWIIGSGPPCQNVSLLNSSRSGAWGLHSCLREEFKRIYNIFTQLIPAHSLIAFMECTRMTNVDRIPYDEVFGNPPVEICSSFAAPNTRPRLWWCNRIIQWEQHAKVITSGDRASCPLVVPKMQRPGISTFLEPGWSPATQGHHNDSFNFRCFVRSVPRSAPMYDPRGIDRCDQNTLERWEADKWAQSPNQYQETNMVKSEGGILRRLIAIEEERIMGFPTHFTAPILQLSLRDFEYEHRRRSLLGNSWSIFVVIFLLQCFGIAESNQHHTVQTIDDKQFFSEEYTNELSAELRGNLEQAVMEVKTMFPDPVLHVPFSQTLPSPLPTFLGPDQAELWAAQSCSTMAGIQTRNHGFAVSRSKMVPNGLPPITHSTLAAALKSPLDQLPALADDLRFACDQIMSPGYKEWIIVQRKKLLLICKKAETLKHHFQRFRTPAAMNTCPDVHPHLLLVLTHLMQWPDTDMALLPLMGVPVVGHIPSASIFRHSDKQATIDTDDWASTADQWNRSICQLQPPKPDQMSAVWSATTAEQVDGVAGNWNTYEELNKLYGAGNWRAMIRFAIQQGDKWRCIDNGRTSCHNDTVTSVDKIHTTSIEVAAAITAYIHAHDQSTPKRRHFRATKDMKRAYRQIPIMENQARFHIIAVWHPHRGKWVFTHLHGMAFGLYAAVGHFNRVPAFLIAIARRFFGIPVISYFDDVRLHAIQPYGQIIWDTFSWLMKIVGYIFDLNKDFPMAPSGIFLGFTEDLSEVHDLGIVKLTPKPEFIKTVTQAIESALTTRTLQHGEARSLRGKIIHMSNGMTGRVGRGQTFAFEHLLQSDSTKLPESLEICLKFHAKLISTAPWRIISLKPKQQVDYIAYTDAAATGEGLAQTVTLSFILLKQHTAVRAGRAVVTIAMLQSFEQRNTYIAHGEALACLFFLWHMKNKLKNASIMHFIDNLGVLSAFCKGSSSVQDISCIIAAALSLEASLGLRSWKEHVDSKANLADCGTKDVFDHVSTMGATWETLQLPPWPQDVRTASCDEWLSWYTDSPK
jgi:hypothetical protein